MTAAAHVVEFGIESIQLMELPQCHFDIRGQGGMLRFTFASLLARPPAATDY
jgi:hypothetical protein